MSNKFLKQAEHNFQFYQNLEEQFPKKYSDWKITVIFYTSLHLLDALAYEKGINIGNDHKQRTKCLNPEYEFATLPLKVNVFNAYKELLAASMDTRYKPPVKRELIEEVYNEQMTNMLDYLHQIITYVQKNSSLDCSKLLK